MSSALSALENSVAVFEVPTADVQEDPETGNVIPVNETLSYRLYLRRGSSGAPRSMQGNKNQISELPGIDVESAAYEGYCISPTQLDSRIRAGTRATLTFAGEPPHECTVQDCRFVYGSTGLLGETLMNVLGQGPADPSDYLGVD